MRHIEDLIKAFGLNESEDEFFLFSFRYLCYK
jgi:hypothetical protein